MLDTLPYQDQKTDGQQMAMEREATYRGTVYPWQCDHVGRMNIMWYVGKFRETALKYLAEPVEA